MKSFGWFESEDGGSISIAMEHCEHGDLYHFLIGERLLSVKEVQQVMLQVLEGLHEMHKNDFAHRDLKPGVGLSPVQAPEYC